jgi:hypothetical protein
MPPGGQEKSRYGDVSLQANASYLDALAAVDESTKGKQAPQRLTTMKKDAAGRSCPGFNPLVKAKIPHTLRCHVTACGRQAMGTSLYLREHHFPNVCATPAAA